MAEAPAPAPIKVPKVRMSKHLLVERASAGKVVVDRIEVREMRDTVRLIFDKNDNDIGKDEVTLTLAEARALATMLNDLARKVGSRPSYKA